jgi:paired small multidrug resistance pump
MNWIYVIIAGIIELIWVPGLKTADSPLDWIFVAGLIALSFYLIIQATKSLPVGTVYAVFTGLGTAGVILVDVFIFGESLSLKKLAFVLLIVIGAVGLKMINEEVEETNNEEIQDEGGN